MKLKKALYIPLRLGGVWMVGVRGYIGPKNVFLFLCTFPAFDRLVEALDDAVKASNGPG